MGRSPNSSWQDDYDAETCPKGLATAASRNLKGSADLGHLVGAQLRDRLDQERFRYGSQVVEADRALAGHAVARVELNLGLDAANRAGDQRDDDVAQFRDRLVARQHADRATSLLCQLKPADLASGYQRSSRIASRAFAVAHWSSRSSAEDASLSRYDASSSCASTTRSAAVACASFH